MPSTMGKCKLFRIKHNTLLEGETFLRNKHEIAFFQIKCTFFWQKRKHHYSQLAKRIRTKPNLIRHTSNHLLAPPGTTIKYYFAGWWFIECCPPIPILLKCVCVCVCVWKSFKIIFNFFFLFFFSLNPINLLRKYENISIKSNLCSFSMIFHCYHQS